VGCRGGVRFIALSMGYVEEFDAETFKEYKKKPAAAEKVPAGCPSLTGGVLIFSLRRVPQ
jgi:hypothetical protein